MKLAPVVALVALLGQIATADRATVWKPMDALTTRLMDNATAPHNQELGAVTLTLPLYNVQDFMYYFKMQVGTPPQTVRMAIDTVASDVGISSVKSGAHMYYNHSRSSTYKPDGRAITFRDGMKGALVQDRLILHDDVAADDQHFAEITDVSAYGPYYVGLRFDGWFGIGANSTESVSGLPTLVRLMAKLRVLEMPCVAIYTPRGENGHITFGSQMPFATTGLPIKSGGPHHAGLWGFDVSEIKIGGSPIPTPSKDTDKTLAYAALDNTTPFIEGPAATVDAIAKHLHATPFVDGLYTVPCDADLPNISFWVAHPSPHEEFTLTKAELIGRRTSETDCMLIIAARTRGDDTMDWALGIPVFHRYSFGFCWPKEADGAPLFTASGNV